ncbi:phosphoribosylanthranilate isomerase [Ereboglobus sp. PH5-10]|uniref:phosphoribosylanthranilate isomerase n=1 Tax=Ereboglobus sp. PH5-10 TaxID=2940629 RepID=UPI002406E554|nr:phosphoribosylanthranilate isomerase [Ereboglobus sp. PH5-10]MDF9826823.1 phosphoribosylanthranilate isomerase [Ereboglobus sp. PH5-10]
MKPKIKICGLTRGEDIDCALSLGADYIGFVLHEKSPRFVAIEKLKSLLARVRNRAATVGVFVNPSAKFLHSAMECGLDIAQLHGDETDEFVRQSRFPVWKTFRLETENDVTRALHSPAACCLADASCGPVYGGSGQVANWRLVARLSQQRPVVLAGGINAANIRRAVAEVRPFAIDISSGVESAPGIKDGEKLRQLFSIIKTP